VVRALEVTLASGTPFSAQQRYQPPRVRALLLGLIWPRDELRRRIDARVDARLIPGQNMLDEVRGLLARGVPSARLLELGLEYRFLTRHLLGEIDYETMVAGLKTAIYQFAKRQLTWFRADPAVRWFEATPEGLERAHATVDGWLHTGEAPIARCSEALQQ
jgi:tRNA dimethylallyltransferase